ncbi:hypothetical protein D5F24_19000 [Shigella flexneri]|nr:hypothetical protein B4376_02955 [Shigella flexneri 1a]AXC58574.1 hypothetical protein B5690_21285 [Shigella flexneri 2a]EAA0506463.1 hypothetical protein [Shigella flexneri]EFY7897007.1 hypothetical protein [Shigella sonnei]EGD9540565.1 hypothetical protein [Escherichia coli]RIE86860.1 hypothetical protein CUA67_17095 [Shigella dysenteriae]
MHVHSKDLFYKQKKTDFTSILWLCQVLPANAVTIQSFINGFYNEHPGSEINLIACRENSNALLIKI